MFLYVSYILENKALYDSAIQETRYKIISDMKPLVKIQYSYLYKKTLYNTYCHIIIKLIQ